MTEQDRPSSDPGTELPVGVPVATATVLLAPGVDDPAAVVHGSPATSSATLVDYPGAEVGLWQMTPGTMTDVESDEVFVVLSGAATVVVEADDDQPRRTLTLAPGDVVRLTAGMRTTWSVSETLRKLYVAPGG